MTKGIGLSNTSVIASINDLRDDIKENIKRIILTRPRERVNFPEFGVGIQSYLFSIFEDVKRELEGRIRKQISKYEPRVIIDSLILTSENQAENPYINIKLRYRVREEFLKEEELEITVTES